MSAEFLVQPEVKPNVIERGHEMIIRLGTALSRVALVGGLLAGGVVTEDIIAATPAHADSISDALSNYPYKSMPCEHANSQGQYSASGYCPNYDWGPIHTTTYGDPSTNSERGFGYRNCTDWVAYRLHQLTGAVASSSLGNGGDWYNNAPASERSSIPKAWDAAVIPATYDAKGNETSYGHVAFVESMSPDSKTMTISEYNHDALGDGDERTVTVAGSAFTEFVDFGVHPAAAAGSGVQMLIDSAGQVWAKNSIGTGNWTEETPSGEKVIAAGSSGLQMLIDGAGQVWAKNSIGYGNWIQESPAGIVAIAAGDNNQQMILDSAGQVWAKGSIGSGGWILESPKGEKSIAVGDNGLQMLLDGSGKVWAKNSIGNGGWIQESPSGEKAISAGGNGLQMLLDGSGKVWAKNSIGNGGWIQESPAAEKRISAGSNGIQMILDNSNQVWAKNSIGYGNWIQESPAGETQISSGGEQMILDSAGQVWAKTSIGTGNWTQETPRGEQSISAG